MLRSIIAVALMSILAPVPAGAGPTWSLGAAFGGGSYEDDLFTRSQPAGFEGIHSGPQIGGSVRCEITSRWAVELEAVRMKGSAEGPTSSFEETSVTLYKEATAIPVNALFRVAGSQTTSLRCFAGGGLLVGARWRSTVESYSGTVERSSPGVTRPYGQAGLEAGWRAHKGLEFTGRVLGRLAQANHVQGADGTDLVIDHTGIAFALGARIGLSL